MVKATKPKRSPTSIFNEEDTHSIYENILLVCESDRKAYGKADILKNAASSTKASPSFDFIYDNYENEMQNPKDNVFYFSAETTNQSTKRNHSNVVKQWYMHIRNAFAHNYIRQDNGAYVFEDFYQGDNQPLKQTLYARITNLDDFKNLIKEVKSKLN